MTTKNNNDRLNVGIYGNTSVGKTRFVYAVCDKAYSIAGSALNDNASSFYKRIQGTLKHRNKLETTTGITEGIEVSIRKKDLDIAYNNAEDKCAFVFKDWSGELISEQAKGMIDPSGTKSGPSDLEEAIRKCDAFIYVVNPFNRGQEENVEFAKIKETLDRELETLQRFLKRLHGLRGNNYLPVMIVITHDDIIQKSEYKIQSCVSEWKSKAVKIIQEECKHALDNYFPSEMIKENSIFYQISLIASPEITLRILGQLCEQRKIADNFKKPIRLLMYTVLLLLLLLIIGIPSLLYFGQSKENRELTRLMEKVKEKNDNIKRNDLEKGIILEAIKMYKDLEVNPLATQIPDEKQLLKNEIDSKFKNLEEFLKNKEKDRNEKFVYSENILYGLTIDDVNKFPEWNLGEIFKMLLALRIEDFFEQTTQCLRSCEKVDAPPLLQIQKLCQITDDFQKAEWLRTIPADKTGETMEFRNKLDELLNFLNSRIAENGYTVRMQISATSDNDDSTQRSYLVKWKPVSDDNTYRIENGDGTFKTLKSEFQLQRPLSRELEKIYGYEQLDTLEGELIGSKTFSSQIPQLQQMGLQLITDKDTSVTFDSDNDFNDHITVTIFKSNIPSLLEEIITQAKK